jgi:hypothetical protein
MKVDLVRNIFSHPDGRCATQVFVYSRDRDDLYGYVVVSASYCLNMQLDEYGAFFCFLILHHMSNLDTRSVGCTSVENHLDNFCLNCFFFCEASSSLRNLRRTLSGAYSDSATLKIPRPSGENSVVTKDRAYMGEMKDATIRDRHVFQLCRQSSAGAA